MYPPPDGHPATQSFWANLTDPVPELLTVVPDTDTPLTFNTLTNQSFVRGTGGNYNISGRVSGGDTPYSYSMTPATTGITIGASTGIINVSTSAAVQAATTYTVVVTDSDARTASRTLTITVENDVSPPNEDGYNIVNVTTSTGLRTAITNAGNAKTKIRLAAGTYGAVANFNNITRTANSHIIIESANYSNPANFSASDPINMVGCSFITLRWLNFEGGTSNNTTALRIATSNNIVVERCSFQGYREQLTLAESDNVVFQYNTMTQSRMDFIRIFYHCTNILIYKVKAYNHFLANIGGEHRDFVQFATNPNNLDGSRYGTNNVTIKSCIFINDTIETKSESEGAFGAQSVQTMFVYNDILRVNSNGTYPTYGAQHLGRAKHLGLLIEDCYGRGHNINGVALCGTEGAIVRRVVLRQADFPAQTGNATKMSINFYVMKNAGGTAWNEQVDVHDVVIPSVSATRRTIENDPNGTIGTTAQIGSGSVTNITASNTAWPTGWPNGTSETIAGMTWAGRDAT
jgi:hypothetical protein